MKMILNICSRFVIYTLFSVALIICSKPVSVIKREIRTVKFPCSKTEDTLSFYSLCLWQEGSYGTDYLHCTYQVFQSFLDWWNHERTTLICCVTVRGLYKKVHSDILEVFLPLTIKKTNKKTSRSFCPFSHCFVQSQVEVPFLSFFGVDKWQARVLHAFRPSFLFF